jgi:hypothetical protein
LSSQKDFEAAGNDAGDSTIVEQEVSIVDGDRPDDEEAPLPTPTTIVVPPSPTASDHDGDAAAMEED